MWNIFDITMIFYWNLTNYLTNKYNFIEYFFKFYFIIQDNLFSLVPEITFLTNVTDAVTTAFKFLILIAMLIFIRGGIPRYRYDFLTKIGWIKFLSLVLAVFLSSLIFVYVM